MDRQLFHFILTGLLALGAGFGLPANAQWCSSVHRPADTYLKEDWRPPVLERFHGSLSPEHLAKFGLRLNPVTHELHAIVNGFEWRIGKLQSVRAKYLFEWAEQGFHDYLKANNGVSDGHMKQILAARGQAAGKGFYVSMDPVDSHSYGSHITVFKPQKPLVVLEFDFGALGLFQSSTDFVTKLGEAGIDALRTPTYTRTWLSVIHNRSLQKTFELPSDVLLHYLKQPEYLKTAIELIQTPNVTSSVWKQIPDDNPLKRLYGGAELRLQDLQRLVPFAGQEVFNVKDNGRITNPIVDRLVDFGLSARSRGDFAGALKLIGTIAPRVAQILPDESRMPEQQKLYLSILDLYDLRLPSYVGTPTEKLGLSLRQMKAEALKYQKARQQLDLSRINTFSDFVQAAEKLFSMKFEIRDSEIKMGESAEASKDTIEVTPQALRVLEENPLLNVSPSKLKPLRNGNERVVVSYWSLQNPNLYLSEFLGLTLLSRLRQLRPGISHSHPDYRDAQKETIGEVARILFERPFSIRTGLRSSGDYSALQRYRDFMSLHPFRDGNGRAGRLYYEWTVARYTQLDFHPDRRITLPVYDLDLFVPAADLPKYNNQGAFLRYWVSLAKTDKEFVERSRWALEMLAEAEPQLVHPE